MQKLMMKNKNENLLKVNYSKALTDDDFKEVVDSLNISTDIKMKYTSRLNEVVIEKKHCKNCKSLLACQNLMKGYALTPKASENSLTFSYIKCHYKEEMDKKSAYTKNIYFFEVPPILKSACFKNIYKDDKKRLEIIKKIRNFYDEYQNDSNIKGIYLTGNFGSGKTYLLAALFNELAKLGIRSAIIYFPEFLRSLKAGFNSSFECEDIFENVKKAPLLLFDDIGAERLTDWARDEILGTILQYRMENNLPTFFTSNYSIEELENHLQITNASYNKVKARRIIERINFLSDEVTLIGINRRRD